MRLEPLNKFNTFAPVLVFPIQSSKDRQGSAARICMAISLALDISARQLSLAAREGVESSNRGPVWLVHHAA
jgi:hypothetical protein